MAGLGRGIVLASRAPGKLPITFDEHLSFAGDGLGQWFFALGSHSSENQILTGNLENGCWESGPKGENIQNLCSISREFHSS